MTEIVTQLGIGGILVLLVVREFLTYLARRRDDAGNNSGRRSTDRFKTIQGGVDAVLIRLERIIERLDDVVENTRAARKQSEITGEMTERMCRAVATLEENLNDAGRRRTVDTQPGV